MKDQKECPVCGETILAIAKKCKHCGEFLDGHTREEILSSGGPHIGGNVSASRDFVGRDKISVETLDERTKNYEDLLHTKRYGITDPAELDFVGYDLSGRNLAGFRLKNAQLSNTNLCNANLRGADLSGAILEYAVLRCIDLSRRANLSMTNLFNADLSEANLSGADLSSADLRDATLLDANLSDAKLRDAKYNLRTVWPHGFDAVKAGALLIEDD